MGVVYLQEILNVKIPLSKAEKEYRAYCRAKDYVEKMVREHGFCERVEKVMRTMAEKVAYVHERFPETKGNYALLTKRTWEVFYGVRVEAEDGDFERLVRLPSPDSLGRIHRFFEENGLYQPTLKTMIKRSEVLEPLHRRMWVNREGEFDENG